MSRWSGAMECAHCGVGVGYPYGFPCRTTACVHVVCMACARDKTPCRPLLRVGAEVAEEKAPAVGCVVHSCPDTKCLRAAIILAMDGDERRCACGEVMTQVRG